MFHVSLFADGNRHSYEWYTCVFLVYSMSSCTYVYYVLYTKILYVTLRVFWNWLFRYVQRSLFAYCGLMALLDSVASVHAVCWLCLISSSMLLAILVLPVVFLVHFLCRFLFLLLFVLMLVLPLVLVMVMVLAVGRSAAVRSLMLWFLIGLFLCFVTTCRSLSKSCIPRTFCRKVLSYVAQTAFVHLSTRWLQRWKEPELIWCHMFDLHQTHVEKRALRNSLWNKCYWKLGLCQVHKQQRAYYRKKIL